VTASLAPPQVIAWESLAACLDAPPSLFAAVAAREPFADRTARDQEAKAVCSQCPVRTECLDYALRVREPLGIWGGLDESERRALIRAVE
jgi:WhiB family redox-sensing transcriptional regulator